MAGTLDRPALITPGLRPADPRRESWWVRPGGATVVRIRAGDRVTVRDPDGGQVAELTVLDAEGRDDAGALGARADAPATVLLAALARDPGRRAGRPRGRPRRRAAAAAGRSAPGLPRRPRERAQLRGPRRG